ncbi:hypothetical protein ACFE04_021553 [Oxalis oulophora]
MASVEGAVSDKVLCGNDLNALSTQAVHLPDHPRTVCPTDLFAALSLVQTIESLGRKYFYPKPNSNSYEPQYKSFDGLLIYLQRSAQSEQFANRLPTVCYIVQTIGHSVERHSLVGILK